MSGLVKDVGKSVGRCWQRWGRRRVCRGWCRETDRSWAFSSASRGAGFPAVWDSRVRNRKEELVSASAQQDQNEATRQLALDIYKQLIGINTNPLSGQRNRAYGAFAKCFCDAEFPESDISVLGPNDRKKNIVVRLVGSDEHKPMLLSEHLDATHGGGWNLLLAEPM
ncbi:MAG TPA: hypothetical protein VMU26_02770 [Candidatus Polarisedimenticolia bacterium]|nr:hypothetical protein [Candidatus Polarisedimenticolia bacterium]